MRTFERLERTYTRAGYVPQDAPMVTEVFGEPCDCSAVEQQPAPDFAGFVLGLLGLALSTAITTAVAIKVTEALKG
jgi:MYXO-CTERM domain-containing protein